MTDRPAPRLTAAFGIKAILALQIGIAAILFGGDLARVIPKMGFSPDAPRLTGPVLPGDQTRRYDRKHVPTNPDLPGTGDMPSRLMFEADGNTLRMTGAIAEGDAERLTDWLTGREMPNTVQLHSTGGSVQDALAIGKTLRGGEANTEITEGAVCLSACPYILASGTERHVHKDGFVGVHQHYFGENIALPAFLAVEDIQRGQGQVMTYLDAMGIDPLLMQHALVTPPEEIYVLLPEELETYKLATKITE